LSDLRSKNKFGEANEDIEKTYEILSDTKLNFFNNKNSEKKNSRGFFSMQR
jgi:hypothetical protein